MWTRDAIHDFIKSHPINTNGALNQYKITQIEKDDGDEWVEICLPFWSNNNHVVKGILKFALDALEQDSNTHIYLDPSLASNSLLWRQIKVLCYLHTCDPD